MHFIITVGHVVPETHFVFWWSLFQQTIEMQPFFNSTMAISCHCVSGAISECFHAVASRHLFYLLWLDTFFLRCSSGNSDRLWLFRIFPFFSCCNNAVFFSGRSATDGKNNVSSEQIIAMATVDRVMRPNSVRPTGWLPIYFSRQQTSWRAEVSWKT